MTLAAVTAEIERRVRDQLPARLLDLAVTHHAKRGHAAGCDCSFCTTKRQATADIKWLGSRHPYAGGLWVRRSRMILEYRAKLKLEREAL